MESMEKTKVDTFIANFMKVAYNYAYSKTINSHETEELASMIIYEVYIALLKHDLIQNLDAYAYRIAQNVYSKYIEGNKQSEQIKQENLESIDNNEIVYDYSQESQYLSLRRQIAFLGETQRNIMVMHYFDRKKIEDIAEELNLPIGTVKFHLHDARNQLKENIDMKNNETIDMKPIKFTTTWCSGLLAPFHMCLSSYPERLLSQNILFLTYFDAKSKTEIARELGIGTAYIEDEIKYLLEFDYIRKLSKDKYRSNIFIDCSSKKDLEKKQEIYERYAKIICDKYMPLLLDTFKDTDLTVSKDGMMGNVYSPGNDFNYFLWSIINFALSTKLYFYDPKYNMSKYYVKRIDGSENILHASLNQKNSPVYFHDRNNLSIFHFTGSLIAWDFDCYYDTSKENYTIKTSDYENLFDYMTGKNKKNIYHIAKFVRLYNRDFLVVKNNEYEYVNMVVMKTDTANLRLLLPELPKGFKKIYNCLGDELFDVSKDIYPKHIHEMYRAFCHHSFGFQDMKNAVIKYLCKTGILKPLTEDQKKNVNKIVFFNGSESDELKTLWK